MRKLTRYFIGVNTIKFIIYWWNICNDLFTARLHVGSVSLYEIVEHCNKYKINSAKVNSTILLHNFGVPKLRIFLHQHHGLALLLEVIKILFQIICI